MDSEGPLLEVLTRRLAECPAEFLAEPRIGTAGSVEVAAVVADLLRDLGGPAPASSRLSVFQPSKASGRVRNWLNTVLVGCWLLHDSWFRERRTFAGPAFEFLAKGLGELAELVPAQQLVTDPDGREELARLSLRGLRLRPARETREQAMDRLTTLSSVERQRVIRETRAAEMRAREIRAAMARKAAEEAAARYGRE